MSNKKTFVQKGLPFLIFHLVIRTVDFLCPTAHRDFCNYSGCYLSSSLHIQHTEQESEEILAMSMMCYHETLPPILDQLRGELIFPVS